MEKPNAEEIINRAIKILEPLAKKEKEEDDAYYVAVFDEDGDIIIESIDEFYCKKCQKKGIARYKEANPEEKRKIDCICGEVGESENFAFCDICGKRLHSNLLIGRQEIEHWEEQWKEEKEYGINVISIAFELHCILNEWSSYCKDELKSRIVKIAINIILENNTKITCARIEEKAKKKKKYHTRFMKVCERHANRYKKKGNKK
jgi:hypothetical protein